MDAEPMPALSTEMWAAMINQETAKTVESILAAGQLLIDAKKGLPYGEFGRLFNEHMIAFTWRTANRLMVIASKLADWTSMSNLPPSWSVLDQLVSISTSRLERGIAEGRITPTMTLAEARNWKHEITNRLPSVATTVRPVSNTDRIAIIRKLAQEGYSTTQMVPVVGRSLSWISAAVATERIEVAGSSSRHIPRTRAEQIKAIRQLANDGYAVEQIASQVGYSVGNVYHIVKVEGIDVPANRSLGKCRRIDANRFVERMAIMAENLTEGFDGIRLADLDPARLDLWLSMFSEASRNIRSVIRQLTTIKEQHDHDGKSAEPARTTKTPVEGLRGEDRIDASGSRRRGAASIQ